MQRIDIIIVVYDVSMTPAQIFRAHAERRDAEMLWGDEQETPLLFHFPSISKHLPTCRTVLKSGETLQFYTSQAVESIILAMILTVWPLLGLFILVRSDRPAASSSLIARRTHTAPMNFTNGSLSRKPGGASWSVESRNLCQIC